MRNNNDHSNNKRNIIRNNKSNNKSKYKTQLKNRHILKNRNALFCALIVLALVALAFAFSLSESYKSLLSKSELNNIQNSKNSQTLNSYISILEASNHEEMSDITNSGNRISDVSKYISSKDLDLSNTTSKLSDNNPSTAVITAVGDIILHDSVIKGGLTTNGKYNFDPMFQYVSPIFKNSDYTIANYEGALNGPPYKGYPFFGGPDEIALTLKTAGVDMVTTANNHAFDRGLEGMKRTVKVFEENGIDVVGTRAYETAPKFKIININGISIGITGYTYETIGTPNAKALNGIILPKEAFDLVDSFNPSRADIYEKNKNEMADRIVDMKKANAQVIIFALHWGQEYKTISSGVQRNLAKFLADKGADVIFAHHPHVLQEISTIKSSQSGKETLVYYSLGNFLANMTYSTHNTNGNAEDAIIAKVIIEKDKLGKVKIKSGGYI